MSYDKKDIIISNPYRKETNKENLVRNIYYGEVMSIDDEFEGGRIKVKIPDFDKKTEVQDLPNAMPMLPKFFFILPQIGEVVRVFIEDVRYPQRGRHWMGSIISQPQKIKYDGYFTALSTTNVSTATPERSPSTYPDAVGVYPEKKDVAILGRDNTDLIFKEKQVLIRAGKHIIDNVLVLNKENPAFIQMDYTRIDEKTTQSTIVTMANKIAFLTHQGNPKFKSHTLTKTDIDRIFSEGHPISRGDVLLEVLEIFRKAILQHVHGYNGLVADKNDIINQIEKLDLSKILQDNIRIN